MRKFKIQRDPYETGLLYKTASIELEEGVTVLVGCNGAGKTTLLGFLEKSLKKEKIPVFSFDNFSQGRQTPYELEGVDHIRSLMSSLISSEGERIVENMGVKASQIGYFMRAKESDEYWILLDGIDSGLSIDNIIDIKKYLFDTILEDTKKNNVKVYIVVSANEYEMCSEEKCFNVQEGKYENISSYEDFKKIILKTKKYKEKEGKKR